MNDIFTMLAKVKRPQILISAARFGLPDYRRDTLLKRILGYGHPSVSGAVVLSLIELESEMNDLRTRKDASYSAARHVEIMIALMGEARLLRASHHS